MAVACTLKVALLCIQIGLKGNVLLHVDGNGLSSAGTAESGDGWKVDFTLFTDAVLPWYPVGFEQFCVKDLCVEYHRRCQMDGQTMTCQYAIHNGGGSFGFQVHANSEAAWKLAISNIGIDGAREPTSEFPLAELDKDTNP